MFRHNVAVIGFALAGLLLAGVAGCAQDRAPASTPVDLSGVCLQVKVYSQVERDELANAISHLDKNSPIIPAFGDYKRMRDQSRACQAIAR